MVLQKELKTKNKKKIKKENIKKLFPFDASTLTW